MRRIISFGLLVLMGTGLLWGGTVNVSIYNGTVQKPGRADRVVLLDLSAAMSEIAAADDVNGTVRFENVTGRSQKQYLLQAVLGGVTYSTMFVPSVDQVNWNETVTVYDVEANPSSVVASVPFFVIYAFPDRIYVQKRLVLDNQSEPPVSYFKAPGIIDVYIPEDVSELDYLTVKNSNMPLRSQMVDTDEGQILPNALKPGTTEIDIAYYVPYTPAGRELIEKVAYDVDHFHVYTMPLELNIAAAGLSREGTDSENGLAIYAISKVPAGTQLSFKISGAGISEAQSQQQQSQGQIVVENRMGANSEYVIVGILILLIILALVTSISKQSADIKQDSLQSLKTQHKTLLQAYAKVRTVDAKQAEILMDQLIAVYKTLERFQ